MRTSFLIAGLAIALVIIFVLQFWPADEEEHGSELPASAVDAAPTPAVPTMANEAVTPVTQVEPVVETILPQVALPPLADSDGFVREQVASWSLPEAYLNRNDLIARASVLLLNAAKGQVPRRQLAFLAPPEPYTVLRQGKQFFVDPAAYDRYTPLIDMLERVPPQQLADNLRLFEPLLREALAQLGERQPPDTFVAQAIVRVQNLPELPQNVELVRPNVMYLYADPDLEALPELEKQLLRMGPNNLSRLQAYLEQFSQHY